MPMLVCSMLAVDDNTKFLLANPSLSTLTASAHSGPASHHFLPKQLL